MRLLLFGGSGQLGSDLAIVAAERGHELITPSHREVEVEDTASVEAVVAACAPDAVINAAAFHKTEWCEDDPGQAFAVNVTGARNVALASAAAGAPSMYVSSDYVFDGERAEGYVESDPARPVNVYGVSKAAGEYVVRLADRRSLVVRGSGLFGHAGSSGKGGNFIETMLAKAEAGDSMTVVDDLTFSPSSTRDMAGRMCDLLELEAPGGIYHVTNSGSCSWFEFAAEIFRQAGLSPSLAPRSAADDEVRRPRYSILLDTASAAVGMEPARPWQEAVGWYLSERGAVARERASAAR